jgi:tetratricopeptide (TPR) repeat protein
MSAPDAGLSRQAIKHYQSGHFREAEQLFRRLLQQDPKNWQFALMLGLSRHSQGDIDDGFKWVKRSVGLGDGQPSTHYYYGRLLTDARKPSAAREQFAQAIALDPNHVEARTGMGLISLMSGDYKRSVGELKTALRANAKYIPALVALARSLVELDEFDEAWPYANKALKADQESPVSQEVMGRVLFGQGQLELAEKCFRKALELRPGHGELHARLADVLRVRHRDEEALQHYVKAMENQYGGSEVVIDTSVCLERIGDVPQARMLLQKATRRWPEDRAIAMRQAELAIVGGDPDAAGELLAKLDQADPEVIMMRARLADATGDSAGARDMLEPLVEADTEGEHRQARLLLARMRSNVESDDTESAREPIAALLKRKPPVPDAVLVWAMVCENAGDFGAACQALEDLLANDAISDQDRRILHNRLANCYDQADEKALAWANWHKGGWRIAPHASRLEAQRGSGVLDAWLAHELTDLDTRAFDDGFPEPVIIAGWPGSGREILLTPLAGHRQVAVLEPEGETRRLEALGLPAKPDALLGAARETMQLARKRFMRGIQRGKPPVVTLEAGWWEAAAIPALVRHFPGATIVLPVVEPADLALQWRVDGYADVEGMVGEYRKELALWRSMRDKLGLNVIEIGRAELLEDAGGTFDRLCSELGLEPAPNSRKLAVRISDTHRFVAEGSGSRYEPMTNKDG